MRGLIHAQIVSHLTERFVTDDPKVLATSMIKTYGAAAEEEARKYALDYKQRGETQAYMV